MNIQLEKATTEDTQELLEMQRTCFAPHLERYEDYETSPATVDAERLQWCIKNENFFKIIWNGLWVGAINIRKLKNVGDYKLHIIYILPEYQNKNLGQSAIQQVERLFPDATSWFLETLEDMPSNRHVYEKMGYDITEETQKVNDKLTLVFYRKDIPKTRALKSETEK